MCSRTLEHHYFETPFTIYADPTVVYDREKYHLPTSLTYTSVYKYMKIDSYLNGTTNPQKKLEKIYNGLNLMYECNPEKKRELVELDIIFYEYTNVFIFKAKDVFLQLQNEYRQIYYQPVLK